MSSTDVRRRVLLDAIPGLDFSNIGSGVTDPVLLPVLQASDETSRQEALEQLLLEHARPTIETVIGRFARSEQALRRDEAEDVLSTVALRLVRRLQTPEEQIGDFESYVATLTYHTIYDFMRRRFPERTRLKNRIRYLLEHDRRFALWRASDEMACGLFAWQGRTDLLPAFAVSREEAGAEMLDASRPHDAVAALFARAGAPLPLETLVRTLAELWDVRETSLRVLTDDAAAEHLPTHAARHETRQFLEMLWREIRLLPDSHRAALLLNLRDAEGVNAVALFLLLGVASFEEIAAAIGVGAAELESIWEGLPWSDDAIAARLGLTRQQVINLRRTAREKLARRMSMFKNKYERRRG